MLATRFGIRLAALAVVLCVLGSADRVCAQRRTPLYQNRSPLSPYFTLFRKDVGGLTAYYTFLRPQEQLRSFQQAEATRVDAIERQLQQRSTSPAARRPSTAARYLDYSHFYRAQPAVGRRR